MTDIENKIREAWNRAGISKPLNESLWEVAVAYNGPEYIFRKGYLAAHQDAAAQIAEKEAEIERLKSILEEAIWHGTKETIRVNDAESKLKEAEELLLNCEDGFTIGSGMWSGIKRWLAAHAEMKEAS